MDKTIELAKEGRINENASIKDQHSIIINAPIDKVWEILADLSNWPTWNEDISKVVVNGDLEEGSRFSWVYNGNKINAEIQLLKEPNELAWSGKARWVKEIYVWQLESDENQTIVTLSASLSGSFTIFVNSHQKVYRELIQWVECLKKAAEQ